MSTPASGEEEKKEQKLINAMFLCDEWKSSKGGLSTLNREFAINLAETTAGSMKIHCYVSNSDDRDMILVSGESGIAEALEKVEGGNTQSLLDQMKMKVNGHEGLERCMKKAQKRGKSML